MSEERTRIIYYGDNLDILRAHIAPESVDLVYLDPPFKSQQQYNLLFRTVKGEPASAQVRAFSDTWRWGLEAKATYERLMQDPLVPGNVAKMVEAFHEFLGPSEMLAYLVMMTPRLMDLHRVLKPTGSLYLHCDPAASHYLKVALDAIFGPANFRNEIIWKRSDPKGHAFSRYPSTHDILLYYAKREKATWQTQHSAYDPEYLESHYSTVEEGTGRRYTLSDCTNPNKNRPNLTYEWNGIVKVWRWTKEKMQQYHDEGRLVYTKSGAPRYKRYLDEMRGAVVTSVWTDIPFINSQAQERLGYPTQKPGALLRRIIQASTNPGDLVLDPFCGCGTALVAAEELERSWIGIDVTYLAVDVVERRLRDHFPGIAFEIRGQPRDEEGAKALAERDRFEFQIWALSRVGAQPLDPDRRGADRGIDGFLPFSVGHERHERAIVQVKSGHVGRRDVEALRGTMEREKAPFALLITLDAPTEPMRREAAEGGFYQIGGATADEVPRLQIITVRELLQGQRPRTPTTQVAPVPQAPRIRKRAAVQAPLGLDG